MIKAALEYIVGLNKPETVRHGGGGLCGQAFVPDEKGGFSHAEIEHVGKPLCLCTELGTSGRVRTTKP